MPMRAQQIMDAVDEATVITEKMTPAKAQDFLEDLADAIRVRIESLRNENPELTDDEIPY